MDSNKGRAEWTRITEGETEVCGSGDRPEGTTPRILMVSASLTPHVFLGWHTALPYGTSLGECNSLTF